MKPFLSWRSLPLCALLTLCITSCKKNDNPVTSSSQQQTENLLMSATNTAADASNIESLDMEDVVAGDSSTDCRTITFDPSRTVYPHIRTVDFGSGCTGLDGITRMGKRITEVYADEMTAAPGTMISETTFDNFSVDGITITGTVMVYVDSASTADTLMLKCIANRTLTSSDGDVKTVNGTTYWKRITGGTTAMRRDDVYQITGTDYGAETLNSATQITWTSVIDANNPVIKPVSCQHRTQGAIDLNLNIITVGNATFTEHLDYGDGSCDDAATLSINGGASKDITLPLDFWPLSL